MQRHNKEMTWYSRMSLSKSFSMQVCTDPGSEASCLSKPLARGKQNGFTTAKGKQSHQLSGRLRRLRLPRDVGLLPPVDPLVGKDLSLP